MNNNKVLLIILDGLGAAHANRGNAVTLAQPVTLTKLWSSYPHTYLKAAGEDVGLPKDVYGNSEVGHLNIGSGKIIVQNLPRINKAIRTGSFYSNETLKYALSHARKNNGKIHLMGCMSDGAVHSHIDHFKATIEFFKRNKIDRPLLIHCFTDGRDTHPQSAKKFIADMQRTLDQAGFGRITTICGRAIAMDRNSKWERTEQAYKMLTQGEGQNFSTWKEALESSYAEEIFDEYINPTTIGDPNEVKISKGDSVSFLNFRADRATQLTDAFIAPDFQGFSREIVPNLFFCSMVQYRKDFPERTLLPKEYIKLSLGRLISEAGMRQLRIAESEKFPHVTYFFNGGNAIKYNAEDRIEIPSPNVPTYDLKPEMSSYELLSALETRIKNNTYDFIVLNIANTDMVGHTGNLEACVKAVKVADYVVNKLVRIFTAHGGTTVITSDHGNVEEVIKLKTDEPDTEHSLNPVPFIIVNRNIQKQQLPLGRLCDIAPTILDLMGISKPSQMTGRSLLK